MMDGARKISGLPAKSVLHAPVYSAFREISRNRLSFLRNVSRNHQNLRYLRIKSIQQGLAVVSVAERKISNLVELKTH